MDDNQHLKEELLTRLEQQNQESSKNIFNGDQDREAKALFDTKLMARDTEIKTWSESKIQAQTEELINYIDSKMKESAQANSSRPGLLSAGPTASGESLKEEVLQLFEDDKRLRNIRFQEVYNIIEQNKDM